jgi:hypothetical protein
MRYKGTILLIFALLAPTLLVAVETGYSVITEESPWGDVIVWHFNEKRNVWIDSLHLARDEYGSRLSLMSECGISWNRPNCFPEAAYYESGEWKWDWQAQDSIIKFMQELDMNMMVIMAPPSYSYWINDSTKWIDYWTEQVERYDGDGENDMPGLTKPVKYWEVINEPESWVMRCGCAGQTPQDVRKYIRISGEAIHEADSEATVIAPCLVGGYAHDTKGWYFDEGEYQAGDTVKIDGDLFEVKTKWVWFIYRYFLIPYIEGEDSLWLKYILRDETAEQIDIVSHHLYWGSSGPDIEYLDNAIRPQLDIYGLADNIWITEVGWKTGEGGIDPYTQAKKYGEFCEIMLENDWLGKVFFFCDADWVKIKPYGILFENWYKKPAYYTLQNFISNNTPYCEVLSPSGYVKWYVGTSHDILWEATDEQTNSEDLFIDIHYSINDGLEWILIAENEVNDGIYEWTIPNTPSNVCRVRIRARDSDDLVGQYISPAFKIENPFGPFNKEEQSESKKLIETEEVVEYYDLHFKSNPFKDNTSIHYFLKKNENISLSIFDITGRIVRNLEVGVKEPGRYSVLWNGCDDNGKKVTEGIYLVRLKACEFTTTKKLIMLR